MTTARPLPEKYPRVVLSDRGPDVADALAVVHDGFVEAGYMRPVPSGRRMHPSYLHPGSFFALAFRRDMLAGTLATVMDGPFGLPCERAFAEEVDGLRADVPAPPIEVGSLVVRPAWRGAAGRITMAMIAGVMQVGWSGFPESPILMTVAPEAERFLRGILDCERLAGPRPLFGAPAVLLVTSGPVLRAHFSHGLTSVQRTMAALALDPRAPWLEDRRTGSPPDGDWLGPLLAEQQTSTRLAEQVALLGRLDPSLLTAILEGSGSQIAA